jgi:hypothetical protein
MNTKWGLVDWILLALVLPVLIWAAWFDYSLNSYVKQYIPIQPRGSQTQNFSDWKPYGEHMTVLPPPTNIVPPKFVPKVCYKFINQQICK